MGNIVGNTGVFCCVTSALLGSLMLVPASNAGSAADRTPPPGAQATIGRPGSGAAADQAAVAALDTEYQRAVKRNDAVTMDRILADDFVVIEGNGKVWTRSDLLESARNGKTHYEHQEDTERTVRVWRDTAIVTAKLWAKGVEDGEQVNYTEWFSDVYVRTSTGWKYVFGQASLPLPRNAKH